MHLIKSHIVEFFQDLYVEPGCPRPRLDGVEFMTPNEAQRDWLERPILEEEVKKKSYLDDDKSPDPDGFIMVFFKSCWEVIKEDVLLTIGDC